MMAETQWHYLKDDQQFGPIPEAELVQLFKSSVLGPLTYVWNPQLDDWKYARDIGDLVAQIESPETGLPPWVQPASYRRRPASITVFGVLNIVFASFAMLGIPLALLFIFMPQENLNPTALATGWLLFSLALGLPLAICELISGIGLLKQKQSGRKLALAYGVIALIWGVIGTIVSIILTATNQYGYAREAIPGAMCGNVLGLIGLIYPILLIIFMRKPNIIEACDK